MGGDVTSWGERDVMGRERDGMAGDVTSWGGDVTS